MASAGTVQTIGPISVAISSRLKTITPNIASVWRRNWRKASDQSDLAGRRSGMALGAGAPTSSWAVTVVAIGCPLVLPLANISVQHAYRHRHSDRSSDQS